MLSTAMARTGCMDIDFPLGMIMALNDGWIYVDNDEILPQQATYYW